MRGFRYQSLLANKLLRYIFGVYLLFAFSITCWQLYLEFVNERKKIQSEIELIGTTFKPIFSYALWSLNDQQIDSNLRGVILNNKIIGVQILDAEGMRLKAFGTIIDNDLKIIDIGDDQEVKDSRYSNSVISTLYEHKIPIDYHSRYHGTEKVGTLVLYSSSDVVIKEARHTFFITIFNALLKTAVLWLVAFTILRKFVSNPLSALTHSMEEFHIYNAKGPPQDNELSFTTAQSMNIVDFSETFDFFATDSKQVVLNRNELDDAIATFEEVKTAITVRNKAVEDARLVAETSLIKFEELFKNSTEGLFHYDIKTKAIEYNLSLVRLLGYSEIDELSSVIADELLRISPESFGFFHHEDVVVVTGKEVSYNRPRDNEQFWVMISLRKLTDNEGRPFLIEGSIVNITDRKQKEEANRQRQIAELEAEVRSGFLAVMSHEILTPLYGVLGMSELLKSTPLNTKQKKFLNTLAQSGENLQSVINNVLDYSKLESGKIILENVEFDLYSLIEECVDTINPKAIEKKLELLIEFDQSCPCYIICDPIRLKQVINNYLGNALKFTKQGCIKLRLSSDWSNQAAELKRRLKVEVEDTGIGLTRTQQRELFKSFTQVDNSTTRQFGGAGLGLAICRQLCELMGGEVNVRSALGNGSCFCAVIEFSEGRENQQAEKEFLHFFREQPLAANEMKTLLRKFKGLPSVAEKTEAENSDADKFRGMHILVAEDNKINQFVMQELLDRLGVSAVFADNGNEAINLIKSSSDKFNLVLMDCEMPLMDGFEATQTIRQWERMDQKRIPIVGLSAHTLEEHKQNALDVGMDSYLTKPIDLKTLSDTLASLATSERSDAKQALLTQNAITAGDLSEGDLSKDSLLPSEIDTVIEIEDFLDIASLQQHVKALGAEKVGNLIAKMQANIGARRAEICAAIDAQNIEGIRQAAHSIVGIVDFYGLNALSTYVAKIQGFAKNSAIDLIKDIEPEFIICWDKSMLAADKFRKDLL